MPLVPAKLLNLKSLCYSSSKKGLLMKKALFRLLEVAHPDDKVSRAVDFFLVALIVFNIIALNLETVPSIYRQYKEAFRVFEVVSVFFFTAEYLLRIYSCTESPKYESAVLGRLRFALRPLLLLDLLTLIPFYTAFWGVDFRFLRAARLFRSFRLLRLGRYMRSMQLFSKVLKDRKEDLITTLLFLLVLLIFSSSLMYFAEKDVQPEKFMSIPSSMWWAVATLTTVGYGDTYPVTYLGKIIASFIAVLGIGMVALPAGILSSGFSSEVKKKPRVKCPHCHKTIDSQRKNHE